MARDLSCIKQFRNSLVSQIKSANIEGIGENVYSNRLQKAWPEEESFVIVSIPEISFDDQRTSPRHYSASATVNVDVVSRGFVNSFGGDIEEIDDLADYLDDLSKKIIELVEPCQSAKGPFNGLVKRCVLKSIVNNLSERSETERGTVRIVFYVEFSLCIQNNAPTDDFVTAENTLSLSGISVSFDTKVKQD